MSIRNALGSKLLASLLLPLVGAVPACAGQNEANSPPLTAGRPTADASAAHPAAGTGADPIIAETHPASNSSIPLPGQRTAFLTTLEKAPVAAQAFARSSAREAAIAAGDALATMADALEALPDPDHKARKDINEIRFQSKRLRRADRLSFGLPKWIKEGLTAATDGLENLSAASDSSRFWIGAARQSQALIDVKSSLTFQRAPVQDALRTTVDAYIVVGQRLCVCR